MADPKPWAAPDLGGAAGSVVGPAGSANGPAVGTRADRPAEVAGPDAEDIPLRPLGIAEILDGAIVNIRRNPRATLGLSLIVTTAIQVLVTIAQYFIAGNQARDEVTPVVLARAFGDQVVVTVMDLLLTAFVVLLLAGVFGPVVARGVFGMRVSLGQAWRDTRPQALRLVGTCFAVTLVVAIGIVLPLAPMMALVAADGPPALGVLATVLGLPLAAVVMCWVYVSLALAPPAVTLERRRVVGALVRAQLLIRGRWWRTFGVLLLTLVTTIFIGFLALQVPFIAAQEILLGVSPEPPPSGVAIAALAIDMVGRIVSGTLTNPFNAGVIALLFVDHRIRREGLDLELRTRPDAEEIPEDPLALWRPTVAAAPR